LISIRFQVLVLALSISNLPAFGELRREGYEPHAGNPILPGYYADPSIISHQGRHWIYATLDPWGGETLGCWESSDFQQWTFRELNWPTKRICSSPESADSMVWAPSVVRAGDGTFVMYVSVGSEIWVGKADNPLGPWKDANGGKPLIPRNFKPGFHMIDAEAFIDDDGQAYLYWGSGLNWVNGKCWAAKLKPDMITFDGEIIDVTPARYFEAPFMVKHDGRYFLMYSDGKTIEDTYQVHYAVGDSPLGPFREAANSPVLTTDTDKNISSPGHHSVFQRDGSYYILYHRHSIPFDPDLIGRQVVVDEMRFTGDGLIERIIPTHQGPSLIQRDSKPLRNIRVTASSRRNPHMEAEHVIDDNHATLWAADSEATHSWLQLDLGGEIEVKSHSLRFEYAWKFYQFILESSLNGSDWMPLADHTRNAVTGSPVILQTPTRARYLRITFPSKTKGVETGIIEWCIE
jgi:arabinoxylan arabinofuranohydrolase